MLCVHEFGLSYLTNYKLSVGKGHCENFSPQYTSTAGLRKGGNLGQLTKFTSRC